VIQTTTPLPWSGQVTSTIQVAQPWIASEPTVTQDAWSESGVTTGTLDALVVSVEPEAPPKTTVGEVLRRAVTSAVAVSAAVGAFAFLAPATTEAGSLSQPTSQSVVVGQESTAAGATTSAGQGLRLTETGVLGLGAVHPEGFQIADARVPEAPRAQKTYPRIQIHKGDYVAHGINFSSLISNEEFTDAQAMSVEDVQKLLAERESFLADYEENGVSAATMVVNAASGHQVNPRIILATLEKEAGLLSRKSDPPRWLLRSAMGYAYNDGGGTAGRRSGFAYQVDNGTRLMRELYDEGVKMQMPAKKSVDYGKRTIRINNAATWALMRYTPHTRDHNLSRVGGGNYLFRNILTTINRDAGEQRL